MEVGQILFIWREKKVSIILVGLLLASFSFVFLVFTQKKFKSTTDFLVVQNQTNNQDFYTLSKSAEYLGKIMGEAIYSELFINEVIKTEKVNENFLPLDKKDRMEEWARIVKVSRNYQLGTIKVSVYDNDSRELDQLSGAISEVLTQKNSLFRGGGQDIEVKILSGPIIEKNPEAKSLILVSVAGFILGILICFMWIYYKNKNKPTYFDLSVN